MYFRAAVLIAVCGAFACGAALADEAPAGTTYCEIGPPIPYGSPCICPPNTDALAVNNWKPDSFECRPRNARGLLDLRTISDNVLKGLISDAHFRARVEAMLKAQNAKSSAAKATKKPGHVRGVSEDNPAYKENYTPPASSRTKPNSKRGDSGYGPPPHEDEDKTDDKSSNDKQPEIPIPH